ncbi:hypothetical protein IV203_029675 [Nitzschia inconspicua]|uniref:Uncharacterized protein n=1 Tax=Nitzschia inconspicua TaxID=303405 RepID=A0A9K3LS30_9STRA|nr:hypothetical protein IV203_029675 [Nitzschia inconspicua]
MIFIASSATQALELVKAKNDERRGSLSSLDSKLSCDLSSLLIEEASNAFPVIQWDVNEESTSDSESVRSLDSWNSVFGGDDNDSVGSGGSKRSRNDHGTRRLVRSKKIKSDLSSLARSMLAARSATTQTIYQHN